MTESKTEIEKKNDWRAVMASITEEASQEADLPAQPVSGWDGEGMRWSWSVFPSENHVEEVILRAYPDAYSAGIQAEVLAVARTYDRSLLWSATTFSTHVALKAFEEGSGDLAEFQEELPRYLSRAWEKAHGSSQELDRLHDEKLRRDEELYEQIAHLMIDDQRR